MTVTEKTTVHELLEAYPFLLEWLVAYAPDFKKLENPVLRATVARAATLHTAASMADTPVDRFLDDIRTAIAQHEIAAQEAANPLLHGMIRLRDSLVLAQMLEP